MKGRQFVTYHQQHFADSLFSNQEIKEKLQCTGSNWGPQTNPELIKFYTPIHEACKLLFEESVGVEKKIYCGTHDRQRLDVRLSFPQAQCSQDHQLSVSWLKSLLSCKCQPLFYSSRGCHFSWRWSLLETLKSVLLCVAT